VARLCERANGHRGLRRLLPLLAQAEWPIAETRSELERRFLRLCDDSGLSPPAVNVAVAGYEVDAVWLGTCVVVELDGFEYNGTRAAFERDRARDADLQLAGFRVLRVTSQRLSREPEAVASAIGSLIGAAVGGE